MSLSILRDQYESALRENVRLRAALKEACDELENALEYKSVYLVKKHCDRETLARLRGELLIRPAADLQPATPPDSPTSSEEGER